MTTKKVDPRLPLPIIDGYEYEDKTGLAPVDSSATIELDIPATAPIGLQPPTSIEVVEQVFRKGPDGKTVVDLVIEVGDVPGANSYEVRTSTV